MNPSIPVKVTGDTFSAVECNEVVDSIISKVDKNYFDTYASMKAVLNDIGTTTDIYEIIVKRDEQNNNGNLTNYTYTDGILNWVATYPTDI